MALVRCSSCGIEVSDKYPTCRSCGNVISGSKNVSKPVTQGATFPSSPKPNRSTPKANKPKMKSTNFIIPFVVIIFILFIAGSFVQVMEGDVSDSPIFLFFFATISILLSIFQFAIPIFVIRAVYKGFKNAPKNRK